MCRWLIPSWHRSVGSLLSRWEPRGAGCSLGGSVEMHRCCPLACFKWLPAWTLCSYLQISNKPFKCNTQFRVLCVWRSASLTLCAHFVGLTDSSDSKEITLKPAVSRSASQRLLATSRPVPPIQNRLPSPEPSWTSNREQEENGSSCGGSEGNHKELISEVKGCKVKKTS